MVHACKRIFGKILPGALILCLMSGCKIADSVDVENAERGSQREKVSGQIADDTHEALTICSAGMNYTYFVEALKEKYPEINLEIISYKGANSDGYLTQQIENGDIPDIFSCTGLPYGVVQQKYLVNLSSYDFINNYSDTMLNDVDVDGEIYMLPSNYQVCGINYNKTMFEYYGWEIPTSFEELCALAEQIEKEAPGVTPVAARMSRKNYPFQYLFALGSTNYFGTLEGTKWKTDFLSGEATATGSIESAADYMKEWIDAGFITDYDIDDADILTDFYDGKIAMLLGAGTDKWQGTSKSTGEKVDVGVFAWPGENGNHGMLITSESRYYGISSELLLDGNEQKLEDALKVLDFISTDEGQQALCSGNTTGVVLPFGDTEISDDSPLAEVKDYIAEGYTVPITYSGWSEKLLSPLADEIIALIKGETDVKQMLLDFDEINDALQKDVTSFDYATLDENLTKEETARLCGIAMIAAADADVSLISLGGITDDGNYLENSIGVQCGIYAGGITDDIIDIFRPNSNSLAIIDLKGSEIEALIESGCELCADPSVLGTEYTYLSSAVEYDMPYVLVTKNDKELKSDKTYRVVFAGGDYSASQASDWGTRLTVTTEKSPASAIVDWLKALPDGHFDSTTLTW